MRYDLCPKTTVIFLTPSSSVQIQVILELMVDGLTRMMTMRREEQPNANNNKIYRQEAGIAHVHHTAISIMGGAYGAYFR
jgi:hypothetical protein